MGLLPQMSADKRKHTQMKSKTPAGQDFPGKMYALNRNFILVAFYLGGVYRRSSAVSYNF